MILAGWLAGRVFTGGIEECRIRGGKKEGRYTGPWPAEMGQKPTSIITSCQNQVIQGPFYARSLCAPGLVGPCLCRVRGYLDLDLDLVACVLVLLVLMHTASHHLLYATLLDWSLLPPRMDETENGKRCER
jgi:hypothetical protein